MKILHIKEREGGRQGGRETGREGDREGERKNGKWRVKIERRRD